MRTPSIVVAMLGFALAGAPAAVLAKTPPCPGGRYLVAGNPLMSAPGVAMDVVDMAGRMVAIESGCGAVKARVRATANGTKLRARWSSCPGLRGKAVLAATITEYCRTLTASFVAKTDGINKPFLAALSGCGDGIWDPDGGEACDAGLGPCGSLCNACSCNGVTTTTVTDTTTPSSTTTTVTSPTTSTTAGGGSSTTIPTSTTIVGPTTTSTTVAGPTTTTPTTVVAPTTTSTTVVVPTTTSTTSPGGGTTTSTMPAFPTTSTTTTTLPGPDLVGIGFTAPGGVIAGANALIQYTVKNQGTVVATAPWYDYILMSTDLVFGNDTAIALPQRVSNVGVGGQYTVMQNTLIPNVPPGTYYLFLHTDGAGLVAETNELNNVGGFVQVTVVAPDLATTAFGAAASGTAGAAIAISYTVKNQGGANAFVPWTDAVYLSTDATFGGDTQIATIPRGASVAVNGTYSGTPSVSLPVVPPGTYHLFFQADYADNIYEGGLDANNVRGPVTITIN